MSHIEIIAHELKIRPRQVEAVTELLDGGCTIPFIARYRKEVTGTLDEVQIGQVRVELDRLRSLDKRRVTIIASIEDQAKMTPELKEKILAAETITALEDLYLPYKPRRKTHASLAREQGLQPLADLIISQVQTTRSVEDLSATFLNEEVLHTEDALSGARYIVAEAIAEHAGVRGTAREKAFCFATIQSKKIEDAKDTQGVYQLYYDFKNRVDRVRPHQILAINRGETEKVLRIQIEIQERDWRTAVAQYFRPDRRSPLFDQLRIAIEDAAQRLLIPALERDVRRRLTEDAEIHAISVFSSNLRALLTQPPLEGFFVLGIDPGFRTGCKVAVVDPTGKLLETSTIYPHPPFKHEEESLVQLERLVKKHNVSLISIGNGTASRETEQLAAKLIQKMSGNLYYIIANEAGASVYSASTLARTEFPDLDVSLRGAVSIARRIQDPLAELVKIDPKSIGVGLYQHDVNQTNLSGALDNVVDLVVNSVGVEVNTASPALLSHVSGIGQKLADRIVEFRDKNGEFTNRRQFRLVNGLGEKAFEQSAGFLRIRNGENPLDSSAIHPESYQVADRILKETGIDFEMDRERKQEVIKTLQRDFPMNVLAERFDTGEYTLQDIFNQLLQPGRDPRKDAPVPLLRMDVLKVEDLKVGMRLKGTVRNVVDFGAFIDIGVKQDGLLHRSQFIPGQNLQVGEIINVEVKAVEIERGRISLACPEE